MKFLSTQTDGQSALDSVYGDLSAPAPQLTLDTDWQAQGGDVAREAGNPETDPLDTGQGRRLSDPASHAPDAALEDSVPVEIGRIITASPDIDEVHARFAELVKPLLPFDRIAAPVLLPKQPVAVGR